MAPRDRLAVGLLVAACLLIAGVFVLGTTVLQPSGSPSAMMPSPTSPPQGNGTQRGPTPPSSNGSAGGLSLSIATDRSSYPVGDVAVVTITLTNVGNATVSLGLPSPCSVVFLVYDDSGRAVFNSTRYFSCIQVWQNVVLTPGASQTFVYRWPLVAENGTSLPAPATYRLVPSFQWNLVYQEQVVRTDDATIDVTP